jgi:holdfast attachment protein HfaA
VIQNGNNNSVFGKLNVSGALDQFSGAGGVTTTTGTATGTATAIGNNLVVTTTGSYNTVIVNANQTNNGTVTATTTVLNGKVNLDD